MGRAVMKRLAYGKRGDLCSKSMNRKDKEVPHTSIIKGNKKERRWVEGTTPSEVP